jgi:hypothetical protein
MELQRVQILESVIVLVVYLILFFVIKKIINNTLKNTPLQRDRRKIIIKVLQLFISITGVVL